MDILITSIILPALEDSHKVVAKGVGWKPVEDLIDST